MNDRPASKSKVTAIPSQPLDATLSRAFAEALAVKAPDAVQADFIGQMAADYVPEELPALDAAALGVGLAELWDFAARETAQPGIRIVRAGRSDRLDVVQGDRPFLVDSVMGEIAERRIPTQAMFHAVIDVARDKAGVRKATGKTARESMIQVFLDPLGEDQAAALLEGLTVTLADVRLAVDDHKDMLALAKRAIGELDARAKDLPADQLKEYQDFLRWLRDDHFIFLGARTYDYPRTKSGDYAAEEPTYRPDGSLGVLRDQGRGVLRRSSEPAVLSAQLRQQLSSDTPLIVGKSNLRSRVHRRAYMDYVGVRRYGPDGRAIGEIRFVGLFAAEAYDESVHDIPLLRRKVDYVLANSGRVAGGHSDRRLHNILENYPRDELFQIGDDELLPIALGVLHLNDRPRVKLFVRRDPYDRFFSIIVYLPREAYDSGLPNRIGKLLAEAYGGRVSALYPTFSDAPLARVHFIIGVDPGAHRDPDPEALEIRIADAARSWDSKLEALLRETPETRDHAGALMARYAAGFPPGYRDLYDASETVPDIIEMERVGPERPVAIRAYRYANDPDTGFRFELYRWKDSAALADVLPILDNMGLKALVEEGFPVPRDGDPADQVWAHEFTLADANGETIDFAAIEEAFEQAFIAVWDGRTENDGFNRLVIELGISWREAALVRALARYRQQSGLEPSEVVQQAALSDHPEVAKLILELFHVRFDPALKTSPTERQAASDGLCERIGEALQAVESLDADRVLRRLAALVQASTRTNYFQRDEAGNPKPYISFKIASRQLEDLPQPRPFREIFVLATHVEGVHLRFGPVARGGIRWSDRRDDFRTEVLGLVKAQNVKNAVIVPVGSKGGFYPKRLPRGGSADAIRAEAVRAYTTFLSGMLDLTDNLAADGRVIHPDGVVVLDDDDPYLVVAADKGTASFSDIANGIAEDYGFWLGDAFASGGSAGYDHKAMGITARGAWEAVKRHFRELGKDIQTEPFTVIGVGDMSGDVFGNGMLLSKEIRLVAAFDHRDVFIDPDPDAAKSFAERKRLFDLPRSSWADYDAGLISKGGGVFSRTLKSVPLTPEIKTLLDLHVDALTPADLISAILKAKAELLYLGGVGTYVKAKAESQLDVGDKANDAVRVDADQLRVQVVGEGANLGVTQAGRIAFARAGGRIDTDAIDNSAGVDTSDHEVNIKILTGMAEARGEIDRPGRDKLLQSMTDQVAAHVLEHNIDQTLALSLMQRSAVADLDAQAGFMDALEREERLDRALEGLPDPAGVAALRQAGLGLTRPELSVLLAYGKLDLSESAIAGAGPDDPYFFATLEGYFPTGLDVFKREMRRHRLRREIITMMLSNDIVNLCGPTFPRRLMAAAGCDTTALLVGFAAAKETLRFDASWAAVAALDGQIPADAQTALYAELSTILRAQTYWLARRAGQKGLSSPSESRPKADVAGAGVPIDTLIEAYQPAMDELRSAGPSILSAFEQKIVARRIRAFRRIGAPNDIASNLAVLSLLTTACDLADLARTADWPIQAAALIYHQAGALFGFDRLRAGAGSLRAADAFERLAVRRLIEDLVAEQTALTHAIIEFAGTPQSAETAVGARSVVRGWAALHADTTRACEAVLSSVEAPGDGWSFAKLTIAAAALRELGAAAR